MKEHAGECDVAAVQLFLCAFALLLFVFPGWMNNALPGQSLTCPLITEGHPVGNTALTCHGKGYSRKTGLGEKWGEGKSEGRRREAEKEFAHLDFLGAVHPSFIWIYLAFLEANNNNVISILPKSPF